MKIRKAFCLFEQSGTFKREFIRLGIPAEDYDILNDFGETDHVIDLFEQIERAYNGEPSLFDEIGSDDIALAFFPCTRFESQSSMLLNGNHYSVKKMSDDKKLEYAIKTHAELNRLYTLICQLLIISIRGGWRLIVENPATQPHYLTSYFPIKPTLIDVDRSENGDYFKKPTQFWFVNCKPEQNMFFEPIEERETYNVERAVKTGGIDRKTLRSLIHPQSARRFIRQFLLSKTEVEN